MLVLTDCPGRLAGLALAEAWVEPGMASLPEWARALCQALAPGARLWQGASPEPDPAHPWELSLVVAEASASQFDTLWELLATGWAPSGAAACLALSGRSFHGQRGRPWMSAPGNLHLCAVFPRPGIPACDARVLPMLPALALVDAVREMTAGALRPGIKWVNDVLLDGRKIGGALTATQTQGDVLSAVLVGLGLNVAAAPAVVPTPFVPSVGSLAAAGEDVPLTDAFVRVLASLGRRMDQLVRHGTVPLLEAYRGASLVIGREICLFEDPPPGAPAEPGPPFLRGIVRDIAADLSLLVEGATAPVSSGRLAFAESWRAFGR